jgi:8-oxo-dGTP diphosphatase
MATPRVAAGVIFTNSRGEILLINPTYKDGWEIPGGYVEPNESPLAAALRETFEELGFHPQVGALLVVDWAPHSIEGDKLLFIFDGGTLSDSEIQLIQPDGQEISAAKFWPATMIPELTPDRLTRRIVSGIAANSMGQVFYLEHGARIPVRPPGE